MHRLKKKIRLLERSSQPIVSAVQASTGYAACDFFQERGMGGMFGHSNEGYDETLALER